MSARELSCSSPNKRFRRANTRSHDAELGEMANWALLLNYDDATSEDLAPNLQGGSPSISLGGNVTHHTAKRLFYHPPPAPQFQVRRRVVRTQVPRSPDTPIRKRKRPRRFNPETGREYSPQRVIV